MGCPLFPPDFEVMQRLMKAMDDLEEKELKKARERDARNRRKQLQVVDGGKEQPRECHE